MTHTIQELIVFKMIAKPPAAITVIYVSWQIHTHTHTHIHARHVYIKPLKAQRTKFLSEMVKEDTGNMAEDGKKFSKVGNIMKWHTER